MPSKLIFLIASICLIGFSSLAQSWHVIPSGTTKKLICISFPSNTVGYIGGADSLILKTNNGGVSWAPLVFSGVTFYPEGDDIVDIVFTSENVGFITVGPYSGTYKTIDGGLTWSVVDNIYMCYNSALYLFDDNNGFLGGSGCFSGEIINRLSNGTWNETNVNPSFIQQEGMINNFDFSTLQHGLATSTGDYFFHTTDGGVTWDTIPNSLQETDSLTDVQYINNSTVLATYIHQQNGNFGVLISNDAGLTWQPDINSATFFYPNMFTIEKSGNGHIYIGGENSFTSGGLDPGLIYHNTGNLSNWSYQSVAEGIRDMDSYADSVVFAVGENGYIIVNQDPATLNLIEQNQIRQISVYPNPSNGNLNIELGNLELIRLLLLDTKGAIVQEINLDSWKEKTTIDMQILPGIYHLKVSTNSQDYFKKVVVF